MKRSLIVLTFLGLSLTLGGPALGAGAGEVIQPVGSGEVNWSLGILLAKGSGAPPKEAKNIAQARLMAERAALTDARRNLLEVLKGVRVDSVTFVENYVTKEDQIRLKAEGFVQGAVEVRDRRRYLSDGAIEVTVAMSFGGDVLSFLVNLPRELPPTKAKSQEKIISPASEVLPPAKKLEPPFPKMEPEAKKPESPAAEKRGEILQPLPPPKEEKPKAESKPLPNVADLPKFTGLVVDARGLNLQPALLPKILDAEGRELYRGQYVPQDKVAQFGLALYSKDLTAAQTNPRVGKNPLTVHGFKVNPNSPSEILLTIQDSGRLAPFIQKGTFLEECKVMIVLE
jgi:hypothetical protein